MIYSHMRTGIFLERPNRFTARVLVEEREVLCHVKNTGRCRELLTPGAAVAVQFHPEAKSGGRKTEFSLIAVWKGDVLVNMDSQAPNQAAFDWLCSQEGFCQIRREAVFGNSRFDLAFLQNNRPGFMEVKGVTLEEDGIARFPDAPTLRGLKHIRELTEMARSGMQTAVLFVIQMKGIRRFEPNMAAQPEFGLALADAARAGVSVMAKDCSVSFDKEAGTLSLCIHKDVPVALPGQFPRPSRI